MSPRRHAGAVYGASKGKAAGSKHYYRRVWSASRWDEFLDSRSIGSLLQVCTGASRRGAVRVDFLRDAPGVTVVASFSALPFPSGSFDTVAVDPPYQIGHPDRIRLQREAARIARVRILFKAPWLPRASGFHLVETVLLASHTCANIAVLSVIERSNLGQLSL